MEGGPSYFPQGFPCLVVLRILPARFRFRLRGFHPLWPAFPKPFGYRPRCVMQSMTPVCTHSGLGSSPFARRYLGNRCFFLFLRVLRCFSSPGSLHTAMDSLYDDRLNLPGFPIQRSADHGIFATPRSLSQLITSFFGSQCQGIRPAPYLA